MAELTTAQKKAIAVARARLRLQGAAPKEQPSLNGDEMIQDIGKSAAVGLGQGTLSAAGAIGDVQDMNSGAAAWIARKFGASPETQAMAGKIAGFSPVGGFFNRMPTTADLRGAVESVTGPFYQPKSTAGEYARTVGEFAPSVFMGPGSTARTAGGKIIQKAAQVAVPAVASETAGQLTEGTAAEPYARFLTALGAGGVTSGRGKQPLKEMRKAAPSFEDVSRMTDEAYGAIKKAKIVFAPQAFKSTAMRIQNDLRQRGLLVEDSGAVATAVSDIMARTKKVNGWTEVDSLRQRLGDIAYNRNSTPKEADRAKVIIGHLDNLINSGQVSSLSGVPREAVQGMVAQARELARRKIIARDIKKMENKSEWYVSGDESGLRNQFASYGKKKGDRLTEAEQAAFDKVLRREGVNSVVSNMGGKLAPLVLGGAAGSFAGPLGFLATTGVHLGARKLSEAKTRKAVQDALKTVLAGKQSQAEAMKGLTKTEAEAFAKALIAAQSGSIPLRENLLGTGSGVQGSLLGVPR